jgi:hypothetical protein
MHRHCCSASGATISSGRTCYGFLSAAGGSVCGGHWIVRLPTVPILHNQAVNPQELAGIRSDQCQSPAPRLASHQHVERTDGSTPRRQFRAHRPRFPRIVPIEVHHLEQETVDEAQIVLEPLAPVRAVVKFVHRNGRYRDLGRVMLTDALTDWISAPAQ